MAISFPLNPTTGDTYTAAGKTWTWNGAQWEGVPASTGGIPSGETADRPSNPAIGDQFYNGTLGVLELYTSSGWLPATGANDFNVVLTGSETSVTLDKEYFAGAYTITSALSDTTFDVYLFDTSNGSAGYSSSPSINATSNFNKVVVYGGTVGDLLSFAYKTTFTTSISTTDTFAAPYIISISVADLPNIDDTTTITGGNFDTDIQVWFDGANNYSQQAKSVVYGSSTSIVATRPDDLLEDNAPYTIRVVNPGTANPAGSNKNKLVNSVTAGSDPIWVTSSGSLNAAAAGTAYSVSVQATDPEGGSVSYSIVSGQLPAGLSLNSATGEISGTPLSNANESFVVAAIDSGGNTTNRSFSILVSSITGGEMITASQYQYHVFTSNSTVEVGAQTSSVEVLILGGGGASNWDRGGGGGAGGLLYFSNQTMTPGSYPVTIGAGGTTTIVASTASGSSGTASSVGALEPALGGGVGGSGAGGPGQDGASGGSGGGGGGSSSNITRSGGTSIQNIGTATQKYGNSGGTGWPNSPYTSGGGGGTGAAGANATSSAGGAGGDGTSAFSSWLSDISSLMTGISNWSTATANGKIGGGGGGGNSSVVPNVVSAGGDGGGGDSVSYNVAGQGEPGVQNTGSGGGGSNNGTNSSYGGPGGSGLVIVRYPV